MRSLVPEFVLGPGSSVVMSQEEDDCGHHQGKDDDGAHDRDNDALGRNSSGGNKIDEYTRVSAHSTAQPARESK